MPHLKMKRTDYEILLSFAILKFCWFLDQYILQREYLALRSFPPQRFCPGQCFKHFIIITSRIFLAKTKKHFWVLEEVPKGPVKTTGLLPWAEHLMEVPITCLAAQSTSSMAAKLGWLYQRLRGGAATAWRRTQHCWAPDVSVGSLETISSSQGSTCYSSSLME